MASSVSDKVPDKNTIWLFKQRLGAEGVVALFNHFSDCLLANGFEVSAGKIVDASFVEVPRQQNSSKENKKIKSGEVPEDWQDKPARMRQKDNNRIKSSVRARVEHVFGFMTNSMGADRIRCIALDRAKQSIGLGNLVYNLFRFKQLGGSMLK